MDRSDISMAWKSPPASGQTSTVVLPPHEALIVVEAGRAGDRTEPNAGSCTRAMIDVQPSGAAGKEILEAATARERVGDRVRTVLLERRAREGIQSGSVTVLYRRWRRPQVVAGRNYRTAAGLIAVDAVEVIDPNRLTDADAASAGYDSVAALRADLRGTSADPVFRLAVRPAEGPDPREQLAADADLSPADIAELDRRLGRLDRASPTGPWTVATLAAIRANPGRRAGDLAAAAGRETPPFKLDVRKLKELGLTHSLPVGYRLSPRGEAYLRLRSASAGS